MQDKNLPLPHNFPLQASLISWECFKISKHIGRFFPGLEERHVYLSVECDIWKCERGFWRVVGSLSGTSPVLCVSLIFVHPVSYSDSDFNSPA